MSFYDEEDDDYSEEYSEPVFLCFLTIIVILIAKMKICGVINLTR